MISQELFDETVLENEECFDLSPDEAVKETIDQLGKQSQGRSEDCLSYIFQSHPNSTKGQEDRNNCQTFLRALETLDEQYVPKDGIPVIGKREEDDVTQIEEHLSLIRQRCSANIKSKTNDGKANDTFEEDGKDAFISTNDSSTNEDDNDQVKTLRIYRQLLLQNGGMYTLMSLLGSRTTSSSDGQISSDIVEATASCLIAILQAAPCSTQSTTTTADSQTLTLRDSFVAWERLVTVLDETNYLIEMMPEQSSEALVTSDTEGEDKALCSLQTKLFTLGRLACQGCETNKVQFVQSRSKYLLKIISNDDNKTTTAVVEHDDSLKKAAKNGVKVTLRALSNLVYERKKGISTATTTDETTTMTSASSIRAIIEICKLIVTVCRYDDSRSEVSSAHDHAMTFFRSGIVPILFELLKRTLQSLDHEEDDTNLSRETCDNDVLEDTSDAIADANQQHTAQLSLSLLLNLAASCMAAVRVTCVNDEIIQHWVAAGLLHVLHSMLHHSGCNDDGRSNNDAAATNHGTASSSAVDKRNDSHTSRQYRTILLTNTLGVIRNICGNDEIKTSLCNDQRTVPLLVQHAFQEHVMNANIQDHACGIVAAMALRVPSNTARMLFQYGVGGHIIEAMTRHPTSSKVQRQGALAIRNMAARATEVEQVIATMMFANSSKQDDFPELSSFTCDSTVQQPSVKQYLLDLGAEQVLRNVAGMSQRSVEEAYAALRDLGCSVTMLTFNADSSSKASGRTVQMFGDIKPKFRSTFEPSVSLEDFDQRIEEHKQRTVDAN